MTPDVETDQSGQARQVVPQSISFLGLDINTSPLPRVLDHIAHLSLSLSLSLSLPCIDLW